MSYSDRLIWLGADSLATRRLKCDLVLFYDIVHDNIDVDLPLLDIVDPNVTHTRGHSFRIIKQQCRINARLNYFACRNVNAWNMVSGLFAPRYFRSSERNFPVGTFAPRNESCRELSLPETNVPNIRSQALSFLVIRD